MIKVWMLVVIIGDSFSMVPMDTEVNCLIASSTVAATALSAYCYEMEQMVPSNEFAPEMSPIPVSKRGQTI